MRSLTLSEITLRAAHSPSTRPKPLKQPHINSSNSNFISISHTSSKLSHHNPFLLFSRFSRQWYCNKVGDAFGHLVPTVSKSCNGLGCFTLAQKLTALDSKDFKPIRESITFLDDSCVSPVKINSIREYDVASPKSCDGLVKFLLLFGFLTLQGSQHALAGTDVASGLQSIPYLGDLGDISTGFASAFLLIFFSELGDKTFFIAALLAARNSASTVFTGTFGALAAMTIISVALGRTFHYVDEILPFRLGETDLPIDDIAAVCLLVYFGVSTLIDASLGDGLKAEDEQKEAELAVSEFSGNGAGILAAASTIVSTFLLVFVAEWGDKSFFSTIALAAASSPLGVIGGALAGHGVATLIAVLGGSLLGTFLSEKVIAYVGGVLFLVFAGVTLAEIAN